MEHLEKECWDVVVVGAGVSGLLAARELQGAGFSVCVLDKGRRVGGRMATREVGSALIDHGAQFVTAREEPFERILVQCAKEGLLRCWSYGFSSSAAQQEEGSYPRYCGTEGMFSLASHLARDLQVHVKTRVARLEAASEQWSIWTETGKCIHARALLLTPPVPQSLALLDTGEDFLPTETRAALERLTYHPCFAVFGLLDGPTPLPPPGAIRISEGPIAWLADNYQKGISNVPSFTLHASFSFSAQHLEDDPEVLKAALLDAAAPWLVASPLDTQIHRWRYSQPARSHDAPFLFDQTRAPLLFAGDAFGPPRIEGAALSGLAAAEQLKELLLPTLASGSPPR